MSEFAKIRVVIVAEQRLIIDCIRSALRSMGISDVSLFTKPPEALLHMQISTVDVLVIDDSLTGQNPLEFVAKLRIDGTVVSRFVPVILIADNGMPKTIMRAIKAGVDEVLVKPVSERSVARRIIKTIENPRDCVSVPSGYIGPDRRRSVKEFMSRDDRRAEDKAAVLPRNGNGNASEK